ncbi:unnamed protein product, partial [Allacma fusca]
MEIKFKILVSVSEIKTTCFYCSSGSPEIITLSSSLQRETLFPDFVRQGNGHTLRAASQTKVLFLMEIGVVEGQWRFKRGYFWSVLREILHKFNFTYVTFPAHGGGGSGTLKNGLWNGAVRDIMDGRADISMATTTDFSRFQVIGGTKPIAFEWLNFILGEPQPTYSWQAIFWSLDTTVW